jgi:hypothetical protein
MLAGPKMAFKAIERVKLVEKEIKFVSLVSNG